MKTLTIKTLKGNAVLTQTNGTWDLFSGNIDELEEWAKLLGYNYKATGLVLAEWVAQNRNEFKAIAKDMTIAEVWDNGDENKEENEEEEFVVIDSSSNSDSRNYLDSGGNSCEVDNAATFETEEEAQNHADYYNPEKTWAFVTEKG